MMSKEKKLKKKVKTPAFQHPKGMPDILPRDEIWWNKIKKVKEEIVSLYDFNFIETPILEDAALFEAPLGATSDVVEKQMFVLKTRGGDRLALRPEGTAGVMRAYMEHRLGYYAQPLKVYYEGPMFRHEQPQAGRFRAFHQIGFEILGDNDPVYDLTIILLVSHFFKLLKLGDVVVKINSIGCRICRPGYRKKLEEYYRRTEIKNKVCKDCRRRMEENPLRLLDCKNEICRELKQNAPNILNHLCQACNNHFKDLLELIEMNDLPYESDPYLVRGFDYYSRTVFEIFIKGNASAVASGGRYDYLGEIIGASHPVPGVGVAIGVERTIEAIQKLKMSWDDKIRPKVFFIAVGRDAKKAGSVLMEELRGHGISVGEALGKESLKAQLKNANRGKVKVVLIFGQKEAFEDSIIIRDMMSGAQETVMLNRLVEEVKKRLK